MAGVESREIRLSLTSFSSVYTHYSCSTDDDDDPTTSYDDASSSSPSSSHSWEYKNCISFLFNKSPKCKESRSTWCNSEISLISKVNNNNKQIDFFFYLRTTRRHHQLKLLYLYPWKIGEEERVAQQKVIPLTSNTETMFTSLLHVVCYSQFVNCDMHLFIIHSILLMPSQSGMLLLGASQLITPRAYSYLYTRWDNNFVFAVESVVANRSNGKYNFCFVCFRTFRWICARPAPEH